MVTGDSNAVTTITKLNPFNATLKDTRTLDGEKKRMHVHLELVRPDKESVITNRYFYKYSDSTSLNDIPLGYDMGETETKRKR